MERCGVTVGRPGRSIGDSAGRPLPANLRVDERPALLRRRLGCGPTDCAISQAVRSAILVGEDRHGYRLGAGVLFRLRFGLGFGGM